MITILVVEDSQELLELYSTVLTNAGYTVLRAHDGAEALALLRSNSVSLMVCDVMMPIMNGFELTRTLRKECFDLPILMITAAGTLASKQEGFRAGTDDYVVKPIDVNEMVWRVEALLRRSHVTNSNTLVVGSTTLNGDALSVRYQARSEGADSAGDTGTNGTTRSTKTAQGTPNAFEANAAESENVSAAAHKTIEETLPQKEFRLLFKLLSSPGRVFTRRQLLDDIWGADSQTSDHTLDVHISRLRERFRENPDFEIVTVRGLGYKGILKHE